jgi:hypothetical protein
MVSTMASYQLIVDDAARSLACAANEPQVARETAYYRANFPRIEGIEDFLGDGRLLTYALKAYGLGDLAYATAFVREILSEDASDVDAFANRLSDSRYRDFALAFGSAVLGSAAAGTAAALEGTISRYVRQSLEEEVGAQNEGVRLALYFERKAPGIVSAYQILADPALLKVALTTVGLAGVSLGSDVDDQADMLAARIRFADFQDPVALRVFIQRFAALWDLATASAADAAPAIGIGPSPGPGLGAELLSTLQTLKLGSV